MIEARGLSRMAGGAAMDVLGAGRPVHTPVRRLDRLLAGAGPRVWAKQEQLQVAGSVKERSAHSLLVEAVSSGRLAPGGTVVESTSGNLGVALARQCALAGLQFVAVVDDRINPATSKMIRAFGGRAEMVHVGPGQDRLAARIRRADEVVAEVPGAVRVDQYRSAANPEAHAAVTMPELVADIGRPPTVLYLAVSTCGTILGCRDAIAARGWPTTVVAVDAEGSALFSGEPGERLLPGLGAGVESRHAQAMRGVPVRRVSEAEMVRGCRQLARTEGILAGASTGAVIAAIRRDLPTFDADDVIAMLVHDSGVPYLDTVYDDDWVTAHLDPEVALGEG